MNKFEISSLVLFVDGLILIAVGLPLYLEKVARNPFYGLRTELTLSDNSIWYPANKRTGLDLIIAGLVVSLGVAWLYRLGNAPHQRHAATMQMLAILGGVGLIVGGDIFLYLKKIQKN